MASEKRWTQTVRDGTTIVVSILLAFGIDASWEQLQVRRDALDSLERVVAEVGHARTEMAGGEPLQERFRVATELLLDVVLELEPGSTVRVPDSLLLGVLGWQVIEAPTNNVASFVASESFELLRDVELRQAIGRWIPFLEDQRDDQLNLRRLKDEQIHPVLRRGSDVAGAQLTLNALMLDGARSAGGGVTELFVTDELVALLARASFQEAIDRRQRDAIDRLADEIQTRARAVLRRD